MGILARAGNKGSVLHFGDVDADFTGIGGCIFLIIILLMFLVSTVIGHLVPALLEVLTTLVGAVLMITAGSLAVTYHSSRHSYYRQGYQGYDDAGLAMGVIAIIAGILLTVDFILSARRMKIS